MLYDSYQRPTGINAAGTALSFGAIGANQVLYRNGSGQIVGSAAMTFDGTTLSLGDLLVTGTGARLATVRTTTATTNAAVNFEAGSASMSVYCYGQSAASTTYGIARASLGIWGTSGAMLLDSAGALYFGAGGGLRGLIDTGGNFILGTTAAGATAAKVVALSNSATAPTTSVDLAHLYAEDISAGNAAFACYQESAVTAGVAVASTHRWPVRINGTTYYVLMTTVA